MVKTALRPLNRDEALLHQFSLHESRKGLPSFEEDAKSLIYKYSKGIPRLINAVSSRALMAAYVDGSTDIKKHHIQYAVDHLTEREGRVGNWTRYGKYAAVIALAILIGVVGALVFRHIASNFRVEEAKKPAGVIEETNQTKTLPKPQPETIVQKSRKATVVVHSAILRQEPSVGSDPVTYVSKGTSLRVIGSQAGEDEIIWYKVKISDGRECWISEKVVQVKEQ
jgi:hypothetical protein